MEPRRSGAGYRLYGSHYLPRLRFIQRAKNLGFTVREIRELLKKEDLFKEAVPASDSPPETPTNRSGSS